MLISALIKLTLISDLDIQEENIMMSILDKEILKKKFEEEDRIGSNRVI